MKPLVLLAAVIAARLTLACGASAHEAPVSTRWVPPRVEVGGTAGAIWLTPTIGMLASVPASGRMSFEGSVNLTPDELIAQGQLRVRLPFGPAGGSRRSLVVGLTHMSQRSDTPSVLQTGMAAHAGMSAQAPVRRHLDLRADIQVLMPFRDGPEADPRAGLGLVWHP